MKRARPILLAGLTLVGGLAGCETDAPGEQQDFTRATLVDGTPIAVGTLRMLNDASTDIAVLDDGVPLPSHAASNLIAHRNGADGIHGTADDDPFDDVAEILATPQIGPARLDAIAQHAAASGFVPQGADWLGTYDAIPFSVDEAEHTLSLVNGATELELDDDIALDRRAVDSILAHRPIASVLALSELYYVGGSALSKLKAWAEAGALASVGEDCMAHGDCDTGMRCEGRWLGEDNGEETINAGKCIPTGNVPGAEESCQSDTDCLEGLSCSGLTIYNTGYCRPQWMFGTFTSSDVAMPIPDASQDGAKMDIVVYGLATVPEDIVVTLDIDHPRPEDLVVRLVLPQGSNSTLWDHDASPDNVVNALGIERDIYVNRVYTLEVVDTVGGEAGVLNGYELWMSSRYD